MLASIFAMPVFLGLLAHVLEEHQSRMAPHTSPTGTSGTAAGPTNPEGLRTVRFAFSPPATAQSASSGGFVAPAPSAEPDLTSPTHTRMAVSTTAKRSVEEVISNLKFMRNGMV